MCDVSVCHAYGTTDDWDSYRAHDNLLSIDNQPKFDSPLPLHGILPLDSNLGISWYICCVVLIVWTSFDPASSFTGPLSSTFTSKWIFLCPNNLFVWPVTHFQPPWDVSLYIQWSFFHGAGGLGQVYLQLTQETNPQSCGTWEEPVLHPSCEQFGCSISTLSHQGECVWLKIQTWRSIHRDQWELSIAPDPQFYILWFAYMTMFTGVYMNEFVVLHEKNNTWYMISIKEFAFVLLTRHF